MKVSKYMVCSCLVLALVSLTFLALPYSQWGFFTDDFGLVWGCRVAALKDLWGFFGAGGLHGMLQPSNYQPPAQTFFAVLYRPLLYVFYGVQQCLFGASPYGFLIVSALLHAANASLLLVLLRRAFAWLPALLGAFYFLAHPLLLGWFGWITGQQHLLALLLLLLAFLALEAGRKQNGALWAAVACGSFFLSLLVREVGLVFPFWIAFFVAARHWQGRLNIVRLRAGLFDALRSSWLLFATLAGYLALRISLFPLQRSDGDLTALFNPGALRAGLSQRFFDMVTWAADVLNLACMGGGNRPLKGTLLLVMGLLVFWLWWRSTRKREVAFWLISVVIFSWPALARFYTSRFLYEALPCLIIALLLLLFRQEDSLRWRRIAAGVFAGLIAFNAATLCYALRQREALLATLAKAFSSVVPEIAQRGRAVCCVGLPYSFFPTGVAQGFYLHGLSPSVPVYYDKGTFVQVEKLPRANMLAIMREGGMVRVVNTDPHCAPFSFQDRYTAMGRKVFRSGIDDQVLEWDLSDSPYMCAMTLVTWDYERGCFVVLSV